MEVGPRVSPRQATWFVRWFGWRRIPLLAWVRPRVVRIDDRGIELRLPLGRRTRNHLGSMYFGALMIGADAAAGMVAMLRIEAARGKTGRRVDLVFKEARAEFLRRADGPVRFVCDEVRAASELVDEALVSGERVEMPMRVDAFADGSGAPVPVATFSLTLSLRARSVA